MRRILLALALTVTACGASDVVVAPEATSRPASPESTSTTSTTSTTEAAEAAEAAATTPTATATQPTQPPSTVPPPALLAEGSPMIRFSVEVGEGIDLARDDLARFVVETLSDERSWIGRGAGFELVDDGGDFTMIVALPDDVDRMCAPLQTVGRFSCARNGWIAFNSQRWFGATDDWPADLETYRRYLVNHEVGHYIAGPGHDACPGIGEIAPVMMQQTKGLDGCLANGWVDP